MDITFILPAILFTLLAIFLATMLFKNNDGGASSGSLAQSGIVEAKPGLDQPEASVNLTEKQLKTRGGLTSVDKAEEKRADRLAAEGTIAREEGLPLTEFGSCTPAHEKTAKTGITGESGLESAAVGETTTDQQCSLARLSAMTSDPASTPVGFPGSLEFTEGEALLCPFTHRQAGGASESQESDAVDVEQVDIGGPSLKYVPGMLRTSELEKMMTKDELEDEQRVQREQLAAIFQLLKQNQETFGEVSEGDVEEQLKLYSI